MATVNVSKKIESTGVLISTIELRGRIDEDTLHELLKTKNTLSDQVVIDFAKVTQVNSIGVRDWVQFMRSLNPSHSISFTNCTDEIVSSILMVRQFAEKAVIQSFLRTYTCEKCDKDTRLSLLRGIHYSAAGALKSPDSLECPVCKLSLVAVIPDDEYFTVLSVP